MRKTSFSGYWTFAFALSLALVTASAAGCGDDAPSGPPDDGTGGRDGSGGSGASPGTGGEAGGEGDDTTPPTIESITPADGATGVLSDSNIVIRFSEPMNKAAAQAAYQSSDIPSGLVVFSWSADGREMTVDPVALLEYAAGDYPSSQPGRDYSISITMAATDRAGNGLEDTVTSTFTTARALTVRLELDEDLSGNVTPTEPPDVGPIAAGDDANNLAYRGFATFSLASLPDETLGIDHADLVAVSLAVTGAPAGLAPLRVMHVVFDAVDADAFDAVPLRDLGPLLSVNTADWQTPVTLDATDAVLEDWDARDERENRSQFRLQFQLPTDAQDDLDFLSVPDAFLDVAVLVP